MEYEDLKKGIYTFEVVAVDRDMVYSEPVSLTLSVIADHRDQQIAELESEIQRRNRELEAELQVTRCANVADASIRSARCRARHRW